MEAVRTVSSQIRSVVDDNQKCLTILFLLAVAIVVYKNCSCNNPIKDIRGYFKKEEQN